MFYNNNNLTTTTGTTTTDKSEDRTDDRPAFTFAELERSIGSLQETTQNIFSAIRELSKFNDCEPDSIADFALNLSYSLYENMSLIYGGTAARNFCTEVRSAIVSVYRLRISFDVRRDDDDKNKEDD